jgi:hypothetical protein
MGTRGLMKSSKTRTPWRRRGGTAIPAALTLASALVVAGPSAIPAQASACSGTSGVTVVVDFTALGGGIATACAVGDPATGLAALQGAGFTATGTKRYGLAFVCRINGLPTPTADPCVTTPPTTAYWSYWHAAPHGTWSFSSAGAGSYNPAPGTDEGWSFGAGTAPGISPP